MRIARVGSWSIVCTTLLLVGLLLIMTLTGCRSSRSLTAPATVRWQALVALHPGQPMVQDIDRRISGLLRQRQYELAAGAPNVPPDHTMYRQAVAPVIAEPLPTQVPSCPIQLLTAADRAARQQQLQQRGAHRVDRALHSIDDLYQQQLQAQLQQLTKDAAAKKQAIVEQYRDQWTNEYLKLELAKKSPPNWRDVDPQYTQALADVDTRLQQDQQAARTQMDKNLATIKEEQLKAMQTESQNSLTKIEAQLLQVAQQSPCPPLPQSVVIRPIIPSTTQIDSAAINHQFAAGRKVDTDNRTHGVQLIDRIIADLTQQRTTLLAGIDQDTRAVAANLASQHGFTIVQNHAPDITPKIRGWLLEYWGQ